MIVPSTNSCQEHFAGFFPYPRDWMDQVSGIIVFLAVVLGDSSLRRH